MGRTYLFLSGKGGTGKTTLSTSLGIALARKGKRTVLVDADIGLRCADLLLGMENDILYDLSDVAELRCTLPQALVHCREAQGFSVLSAPQMMKPSELDKLRLAAIVEELKLDYDYVLIDCPAGLGRGLRNFWSTAEEAIVVTTPDDASVRAAERLSQLLFEKKNIHPRMILNRADRLLVRVGEEQRPSVISGRTDMQLLGVVPDSPDVYRALLKHKTALLSDSISVRHAIARIADRIEGIERRFPRYCRSQSQI